MEVEFSQALLVQDPEDAYAAELPRFDLGVAYSICRTLNSKPLSCTKLFQYARLHVSFMSFKAYLAFMQRCGIVEACLVPVVNPCGRGMVVFQLGRQKHFVRRAYQLTEKGRLFVSVLDEAFRLVGV